MKAGSKKSARLLKAEEKAKAEMGFKANIEKARIKNQTELDKKWTSSDIDRFRELFRTHEKDFRKIADNMQDKTTADVVNLYFHLNTEKFPLTVCRSKRRAKMSKKVT
jgi:phosphoglycolate phosphatase-like HAD superfamily hydrolase